MLGLCRKAGKLRLGSEAVVEAIRGENKPPLVLLTSDAALNQVKRIENACAYHKVPLVKLEVTKGELGAALGSAAQTVCAAIIDKGFADAVIKLINNNKSEKTAVYPGGAQ